MRNLIGSAALAAGLMLGSAALAATPQAAPADPAFAGMSGTLLEIPRGSAVLYLFHSSRFPAILPPCPAATAVTSRA